MKQFKQALAVLLAFSLLVQCSPVSFAVGGSDTTWETDGVIYSKNDNGTVTAVFGAGQPTICLEKRTVLVSPNTETDGSDSIIQSGGEQNSPPAEEHNEAATESPQVVAPENDTTETGSAQESSPAEESSQIHTGENDGQSLSDDTPGIEADEPLPGTSSDMQTNSVQVQGEPEPIVQSVPEKVEVPVATEPRSTAQYAQSEYNSTIEEIEYTNSVTLFASVVPEGLANLGKSAIIHDFSLHTYAARVDGGEIYTIHSINTAWIPAAVTFDSLPAFSGQPFQAKNISSPGWLSWDLSSYAATWFSGSSCGLLIHGEDGTGDLDLYSSMAENPAYFSVTYTQMPDSAAQDLNLQAHTGQKSDDSEYGYVELTWTPVSWAEGYTVAVFNGQDFEFFSAGTSTFWSSENKGIWPSAEETEAGRISLHHDGAGIELPTGAYDASQEGRSYTFKLIPTNRYGQMPDPDAFPAQTVSFEIEADYSEELDETLEEDNSEGIGSPTAEKPINTDENGTEQKAEAGQEIASFKGFLAKEGTPDSCAAGHHLYDLMVTVPATCTQAGYNEYVCAACGDVKRDPIPAQGHNYDYAHPTGYSSATCTQAAYTYYACTRCSASTSIQTSGPLGHSYEYSYEQYSRTEHSVHGVCSRCGAASAVSYEAHVDANSDLFCDRCGFANYPDPTLITLQVSAHSNGLNSCTGYLELSWNSLEDATGYYVALFNGEVYEYISVGNVTTWSSHNQGIWPTETEISEGRFRLHPQGGGAELNMLPALSYANAGSGHAGDLYYYVSVIPANSAGYANQPPMSTIKSVRLPDTVPPSLASSVSIEPGEYTNADTIELYWEGITDYNDVSASPVSDFGNGSVQYCLDNGESWHDTGLATGSGSCEIDVSALEDGTHVVSVRAIDNAGNTGASYSVQLCIDHVSPTVPSAAITPDRWNNADSASLTWSGISDLTALSRVEYVFDDGEYVSTGIAEKEYVGFDLDLSELSDGEHSLSLRAVDLAGNVGEACTLSIFRDTEAPVFGSLALEPESWTNGTEVTLSWEGLIDTTSGVHLAEYSLDDGEPISLPVESLWNEVLSISSLSDGAHILAVTFEDNAGNCAEQNLSILKDASIP